MNIAISGATGFIGTHLSAFLTNQGHQITPLTREFFEKEAFPRLLSIISTTDIVINLAGAPINHRWTPTYKKQLRDSRLHTTAILVDAINTASKPPQLFISVSAVGYYPSTGCHDEYDNTQGTGFLSELCHDWETAARKVIPGIRSVITRFGIVLSPDGGAYQQLAKIADLKLATIIGTGHQPFTWISLQDLVSAMAFLIDHANLEGIFNLVAPEQITHKEFIKALAQHTHASITFKIPTPFFKLLYGQGAEFLTQGQCVRPTRLLENGFKFQFTNIHTLLNQFATQSSHNPQ